MRFASWFALAVACGGSNVATDAGNANDASAEAHDDAGGASCSDAGAVPIAADRFVASIGVVTHFSYYDLVPYGTNRAKTVATLESSGIRFVRDGLSVDTNAGSNAMYWGTLKDLANAGIGLVLVTTPTYLGNGNFDPPPYANQSNLDAAIGFVGVSAILAFEGPNEVDNNNGFWGGPTKYGANAKAYQAAMYAHAKQIAPGVPVLGLTTTSASGAAAVGDLGPYMDFAAMHPYPVGDVPTSELQPTETALGATNPAHVPWWATEAGYYTAPNATMNVYQPGVSEAAQSKYVPRLYLDFFNAGISHTSTYELIDERVDQTNAEMNYGLLHDDGSPKPAFTALVNLIAILSDPGPAFTPCAFGVSVAGAGATVRQSLFQKRNGRTYLVLWNDVRTWDVKTKKDLVTPPVAVTVTLAAKPASLALYTPLASGAATPMPASTTIALDVPDHPIVLEIAP